MEYLLTKARLKHWRQAALALPTSLQRATMGGEIIPKTRKHRNNVRTLQNLVQQDLVQLGQALPIPLHPYAAALKEEIDRTSFQATGPLLSEEERLNAISESSGRTLRQLQEDYQYMPDSEPSEELPPSLSCHPELLSVIKSMRSETLFTEAIQTLPRYESSVDVIEDKACPPPTISCKLCPANSKFIAPTYVVLRQHEKEFHPELDNLPKKHRTHYRKDSRLYTHVTGKTCPDCQKTFVDVTQARNHWTKLCGNGWVRDPECYRCNRLAGVKELGVKQVTRQTCSWETSRFNRQ